MYESDCIINIGGRFDDRTTGNTNDYGKNAEGRIIHVNIEPKEIGKNIKSDLNIVDTAENFINSIMPLLDNKEVKKEIIGGIKLINGKKNILLNIKYLIK